MACVPNMGLGVLVLALGLLFGLLGSWEALLRWQGASRVSDGEVTQALLAYRVARTHEKQCIALVGSSRTIRGISPILMGEVTGVRPEAVANMGQSASAPLRVLEALASDDRFSGVVVVELFGPGVFADYQTGADAELADQISPRPDLFPFRRWDAELKRMFKDRLLCFDGGLGPLPYLRRVQRQWRGETVGENFVGGVGAQARGKTRSDAAMDEIIRDMQHWDALIAKRGGLAVFIQPPIDGVVRQVEDVRFPRQRFFDRLSAAFPGRVWHYLDFEETKGLRCIDGSHLEGDMALAYTRWLAGKIDSMRKQR